MSIVNTSIHLYRRLLRVLNFLQCPFLLFVRVYWGWQFWQTGWGKLQDISKPIGFFTELGIPFPVFNAWFVSMLECVGGILLILGLASRLISIPLVIDMAVAYIAADREALKSIFSEPDKFYAASPYTFLFASLIVLLFGPGAISLDSLIARYVRKRHPIETHSTIISQKV
ncbi:MAG: DoxX family protein [Acidobacteria bacterium]|nr:MAG: DoxX family protein [Acidobacteriota bacterium]PYY01622.1 MAG: DoxX family protein [Acidobacteriota bacterium]PYY22630.1 MAG: DoxX family protein [Acidobacteriota bacterium]